MNTETLHRLTQEIRPSSFLDYRLYFSALYEAARREAQAKGTKWSWRDFAVLLGFQPTNVMHQIVRGHRPLTPKAAAGIVAELGLKGIEKRFLMTLVEHAGTKSASVRDELFQRLVDLKDQTLPESLDRDTLSYFSEWYHPVIRELVASTDFQADPAWIASKLTPRIRIEQARESLALLERLGLIATGEDGRFVQTQSRVGTGPRVKGMALASFHKQMIELGKESLTRVDAKRRDVSAVTVCVSEETAQRLKRLIHAFQTQILDEAERSGAGDQVVQLNIQLFPFTE